MKIKEIVDAFDDNLQAVEQNLAGLRRQLRAYVVSAIDRDNIHGAERALKLLAAIPVIAEAEIVAVPEARPAEESASTIADYILANKIRGVGPGLVNKIARHCTAYCRQHGIAYKRFRGKGLYPHYVISKAIELASEGGFPDIY